MNNKTKYKKSLKIIHRQNELFYKLGKIHGMSKGMIAYDKSYLAKQRQPDYIIRMYLSDEII